MAYNKNIKPTTNERLKLPTPDYFKRLTKRLLLSLGSLTAVGITITSTVDSYGLDENTTENLKWLGGILIAVGLVGGGIGTWVANLVYDENSNK